MSHRSYALLVLCARLDGDRPFYNQLQTTLATFTDWPNLITLAEAHSLAPLLYSHLRQCDIRIPADIRLQLQGLTLRHRQANTIRLNVLDNILQLLGTANIPVLVLKGGALAPAVYPQPGFRPMNDLDLLVPEAAQAEAQHMLKQTGFQPNPQAAQPPADHHHLPVLMMQKDGLTVSVEIHRRLFSGLLTRDTALEDRVWDTALPFWLNGRLAHTLSPLNTLCHLYQHTVSEPARLIRLVDITAVAEKYAADIDWTAVRQNHPQIIAALSNLHFVSPLSTNLISQAGLLLKQKPAGTELALADWPPLPRSYWANTSTRQILQATFIPSEFSLRFYYGIPNHRSHHLHRWLHHPRQILSWWLARHSTSS